MTTKIESWVHVFDNRETFYTCQHVE